tara:strand:+ start:139 stop:588 length:450 start_codon:yes stop_codon:yes gene_type:complete
MTKLPSNPLVSEVLKAAHGRKTVDGKVKLLQEHKGDHIKALLIWNFDKGIESAIPEGDVPYKKNESPAGTAGHTRLAHEWRTLYNFVKGGNDKLSQMKRETLFVQLLESLHADEAELVCLVKDKELQSKYRISRSVVEKAYPEIVWLDQ